jgi:N-acetylmuramoyl-L-alanine amidase
MGVLSLKKWNFVSFLPFYLLSAILFIGIAGWASRAVTVISDQMPLKREHCFVIDAGHGGIDGGATSCTGVLESAINLEIAVRLDDLMHFLGYETVMIRKTDTSVHTSGGSIAQIKISDLKERVRIANGTAGAVLVSIHQNTFPESRYSGAQVFFANSESVKLAADVQNAFVKVLNPGSNRRSKPAVGVYLMEHINCPGILVECGFLSNPQEEAKLRSAEYQKAIAAVIASELCRFTDS